MNVYILKRGNDIRLQSTQPNLSSYLKDQPIKSVQELEWQTWPKKQEWMILLVEQEFNFK